MAEIDGKKRYILFSKEDGRPDAEKPCAFFASPAGCRNGPKCKFLHGAPEVKVVKKAEPVHIVREEEPKEKKAKKEKREKREEPAAVAAAPVYRAPIAAPAPAPKVVAPKVVAPKAVAAPQVNANDKIVQDLQRQLLEQQKLIEAQMKMFQQQQQLAAAPVAPVVAAPVKQERKENKRKQPTVAAAPTPISNKSPKMAAAPASHGGVTLHQVYQAPTPQSGFGPMLSAIGQQSARPVPAPALSARAMNTFTNNVAQESSDDESDSADDENDFLFGAVNHVLTTGLQNSNNNTPYKQDAAQVSSSPFVSNQDAVKALHTSNSAHALHGSAKKNIFAAPKSGVVPTAGVPAPAPAPRAPVEPFDPASVQLDALPWQQLVVVTQGNQRFGTNYNFAEEDATWVKAKPFGAWCAQSNLPRVLSMDCEMCETTDPVTGVKVENALVRFSVVDCTDNGNVLIDALVAPGLPITDARTHIHGITEQQLAGVTWTLRHAQAALLNLCSDRTVFVGHSLHKDLRALKFNHKNVVDTAYLFSLEGEPGAAPSLRDVSEQILGTRLSDTHDSVEDARASLYAAALLLSRGPQPSIVRRQGNAASSAALTAASSSAAAFSLLVHRIPDYCTEQHVQEMIVAHAQVMPTKILPITRAAGESTAVPSGKTTIFFSSQVHCDLAFDSIAGPNRPDKQNRSQKRVYFKGGGYICVRK